MVCRPGFENDPVEKMRHSSAHVLADAVLRLFPEAKPTLGPCIDNGFYYDFYYEPGFVPEDLKKIEKQMKKIIGAKINFERKELSRNEALEFFQKRNDPFKVEIIESLPQNETITLYQHGDFVDLCKGPHVENTGQIGAVKLLSVAGSYWRGDEKRERLQRIYGTAFASKQDLAEYLQRVEQAKKRDHRLLGKKLDLFSFHPQAPASPFFKPKGALLYRLIIDYLRKIYDEQGYQEVITPQILDQELWLKSGHWDHFKDNMYFSEIDERLFAVKPMNCPGHCLMMAEKKWSYRELPVRVADFGRLHRYELSGVTHGLTRVRTFCQDDAHIFCTPDQMAAEIKAFLALVKKVYSDFEFAKFNVAVATRPEKFLGDLQLWQHSEKILADVLKAENIPFVINPGEGAFYGPKIEFQVDDALGRAWQLGTLQIDYSMPKRFELEYVDDQGKAQTPVMLHRAVLGSMERFLGILIEHTAGDFPFWLAPVQIQILPVIESVHDYAEELYQSLKKVFRVEIDLSAEKLGYKMRKAQLNKIPLVLIIGEKEKADQTVSVRLRPAADHGPVNKNDLISFIQKQFPKNPFNQEVSHPTPI